MPGLEPAGGAAARAELSGALDARLVDYPAVRRVKRGLLRGAWERFASGDAAGKAEFAAFRAQEGEWLEDYTVFRWLMGKAGGRETWDLWPAAFNTPAAAAGSSLRRVSATPPASIANSPFTLGSSGCVSASGDMSRPCRPRGVKLMGDIPIGVSWIRTTCSSTARFRPRLVRRRAAGIDVQARPLHPTVGPELGHPPLPLGCDARDGFPWWRQRIGKFTEIFHIFRIDHVLGFYRIYGFPWRPTRNGEFLDLTPNKRPQNRRQAAAWAPRPDDTDEHKAANRADGDRRLRMVIEAADGGEVVAEDLGWVPDYVRPHLVSLDIAGFRIPHWDASTARSCPAAVPRMQLHDLRDPRPRQPGRDVGDAG